LLTARIASLKAAAHVRVRGPASCGLQSSTTTGRSPRSWPSSAAAPRPGALTTPDTPG